MPFTMKEGGFGTGDYVAFGLLCAASCAGGVWYSALGSRKRTLVDIKDYLLGGKAMSTGPVAMSLIASYVSGVTILGTPAEIYNYGTQYWMVIIGVTLSCVIVAAVYLPVFCTLRLSSSYEYLEFRFNRHVRAVASLLFLLDEVLFLPMVVYVPALAFNQLTGFNVFYVGGLMVAICGIYTALGGLRAVVWTDSVQTGVMFIGVILVAAAGTVAVGGFFSVLDVATQSGRVQLSNWSFSPYERQTGWGAVFGGMIYWTCFNSVNQTMVQRYIALPSKRQAIYSLSAVLNACALVAVEDIMRGWLRWHLKPLHEGIIARVVTVVLAIISLIMLIVIEKLGGVLGVATALSAIAASATCGIFTLGMAFPWVGPRGAIAGAVAGAIVAGTTSMGIQAASAQGLRSPPLNFTMECIRNSSYVPPDDVLDPETIFPLFRISYHWIAPLGLLTTLIVGAVMGYLLDSKASIVMDRELFTPAIWRCLPPEAHERAGEVRRAAMLDKDVEPAPNAPLILTPVAAKVEMNGEATAGRSGR
ncbi:sodium-coupled monocarboxylate transporter 1-like isoform X2 [Leguminivora glycinivorella]|uniref:sodium-coupled monocarboxylate transporter 1-like isoform X2 n=1 Tax=Leguminivora glycinivorella TaxID=1035111 RepID=UPI00200FD6D0|nr:sodium-coupled monocarboxylate transporter 1-like isoform X2 [Leguminivora glycinivorella]